MNNIDDENDENPTSRLRRLVSEGTDCSHVFISHQVVLRDTLERTVPCGAPAGRGDSATQLLGGVSAALAEWATCAIKVKSP